MQYLLVVWQSLSSRCLMIGSSQRRVGGEGVFKAKVSSVINAWIANVFDAAVKVHGARGEALALVADKDYLATLVVEPSCEELAKDFIVGETGCPTEEMLKEFSHTKSLAFLQGFVDHVGIERLDIPFAKDAKGDNSMETGHALAYLEMLTGVRDLAFVASVVQKALLTKSIDTEGPLKLEFLKSSLVGVITIMQKKLVSLEELLQGPASLHIERDGWQMHTQMNTLTLWQRAMAAFSGRIEKHVICHFNAHLVAATKSLQDSIPP